MNELVAFVREYFMAYSLSVLRMSVAFSILPLLGQAIIPGLCRMIMIASLSLILIPHIKELIPEPNPGLFVMIPIFLKESFIGMLIGFLAALLFWIAEALGFFIDNQRGSSMASALDPMTGDESSPLGIMVSKSVIGLFMVFGGLLSLLSVIYESYVIWPVFSFYPSLSPDFPLIILKIFNEHIKMAVLYAAPIMLILFFAEFGLGLMNRFAQQLNVFILAMPVKSGLAMFLFVIYTSFLLDYFKVEFLRIPAILKQMELFFS